MYKQLMHWARRADASWLVCFVCKTRNATFVIDIAILIIHTYVVYLHTDSNAHTCLLINVLSNTHVHALSNNTLKRAYQHDGQIIVDLSALLKQNLLLWKVSINREMIQNINFMYFRGNTYLWQVKLLLKSNKEIHNHIKRNRSLFVCDMLNKTQQQRITTTNTK